MNVFRVTFAVSVLLASALVADEVRKAGDNPKAVLPALRRVDALKRADELLAMRPAESEALTENLNDPFYPLVKRAKKTAAAEPAPVVDADYLLNRAAETIKPQGTMLIGTEPFLLLDGKRYKAGDTIPVTVDGVGVQITVSSIQRNSYTLRLKDQELRREFK